MIAAYLGIREKPVVEKPQYMDFDAFADFMKRTGGKIAGMGPG